MTEILQFSLSHGGAVLFAVVFLEQLGVPIPAAPWLLAAGALCATGEANPALVTGVTLLACLSADFAWFYTGRFGGKRVLNFLCRLVSSHNSLEKIERLFSRHSMPVIAAAKFFPGFSVVASPLAGALGVTPGRFLFFDLFGSALYTGFYLLLGIIFSDQVHAALAVLDRLGFGTLIILLLLFLGYFVFRHSPNRTLGNHQSQFSKNLSLTRFERAPPSKCWRWVEMFSHKSRRILRHCAMRSQKPSIGDRMICRRPIRKFSNY
jgi:membrane protein DedA with SNARE-associated domain